MSDKDRRGRPRALVSVALFLAMVMTAGCTIEVNINTGSDDVATQPEPATVEIPAPSAPPAVPRSGPPSAEAAISELRRARLSALGRSAPERLEEARRPLDEARTGTLAGIVKSGASGEPLSNVQISVEGTGLGSLSNSEGRMLILGVPAGEHTVLTQLIGYWPVAQTITVVAGETAALGILLFTSAVPDPFQASVIWLIEPDIAREPVFTPFTLAPSILNAEAVQTAMVEAYPPLLRDAGIGGTARIYFLIDGHGTVQDVRMDRSSGQEALDEAAMRVARLYRFSPARKGDELVPVWVSFPITFQVR